MNTKNTYSDEQKQRNSFLFSGSALSSLIFSIFCLSLFSLSACQTQTKKAHENAEKTETVSVSSPKVTQIDASGLKDLLNPNGKPLLINFWATWCGPCREEFPDLVKIGRDHKDQIDLITISLDESSEIDGDVPEFLAQMRSESPAYLLKTPDADAAIELVSKDWSGALPFTILFNAQGETIYSKHGKFKPDVLIDEIEGL
jgi:thiol-disulfide isomerase/thioredoxin